MLSVRLYSDGCSKGNPGNGGYGTILKFTDNNGKEHVREFSDGYKFTTNNRMELMGCIVGLEALTKPCKVSIYSDSKYLVDAFNQKWIDSWIKSDWKRKGGAVKNRDLWKRLLSAAKNHELIFNWVKGHAGHPENERCDKLANIAAEGSELKEDAWE